jgi:hypothetical protein
MTAKTRREAGNINMICSAIVASGIILFAIPSMAQGVVEAAADGTPIPWWGELLITLSGTIGAVVLGLLGKALSMLFDWLSMKLKIARLAVIDDVLVAEALNVWQTIGKELKKSAEDGVLSPDEKTRLHDTAKNAAKQHLGIKFIGKALGGVANEVLEERLSARLEARLVDIKRASKAAESAPKNPT